MLLLKDESIKLPDEKGLIISTSNAGVLKFKKNNDISLNLGSFGTILDQVSLDSLLNKH